MKTPLFSTCNICDGTGEITEERRGKMECPACTSIRVVPVGVTMGQLERAVKAEAALREIAAQELRNEIEQPDFANWEEGYTGCVLNARAVFNK